MPPPITDTRANEFPENPPDPSLDTDLTTRFRSRLRSQEEEEEDDDDDVDPNERDRDGCTPLHVALLNGQAECARLMLEAGSEPYITLEGSPALHVAIAAGSLPHFADAAVECVALLVEKEADVFETDDYGKSALHLAAGHGLTKCVAQLLEL